MSTESFPKDNEQCREYMKYRMKYRICGRVPPIKCAWQPALNKLVLQGIDINSNEYFEGEIVIPSFVQGIARKAFRYLKNTFRIVFDNPPDEELSLESAFMSSGVKDLSLYFRHPENINQLKNICMYAGVLRSITFEDLNPSTVEQMEYAFDNCGMLKDVKFSELRPEDKKLVRLTTIDQAFQKCTSLRDTSFIEKLDLSKVTSAKEAFYGTGIVQIRLDKLNFDNLEDISYMLGDCKDLARITQDAVPDVYDLKPQQIGLIKFPKVTTLGYLFSKSSIKAFDINILYAPKLRQIDGMFQQQKIHKVKLVSDRFKELEDISDICARCEYLESLEIGLTGLKREVSLGYIASECNRIESLKITAPLLTACITSLASGAISLKEVDLQNVIVTSKENIEKQVERDDKYQFMYIQSLDSQVRSVIKRGRVGRLVIPQFTDEFMFRLFLNDTFELCRDRVSGRTLSPDMIKYYHLDIVVKPNENLIKTGKVIDTAQLINAIEIPEQYKNNVKIVISN